MTESITPSNIVLTGFMGVGKTAVGREVARRLEREFIDMDALIEARTGMSIPDIFEQYGEAAFREMEREVLGALARQQGLVIATGGGALIPLENRVLMTRSSLVICLRADIDTLLARLQGDTSRPLLAGQDPRGQMERLLAQRARAYEEIPYQIDTTGRSVDQVADEIIRLAQQHPSHYLRMPVAAPHGQDYPILLGAGLLTQVPRLLREQEITGDVVVVSDTQVAPHWSFPLVDAFAQAGVSAQLVTLPAGEAHKNLDSIRRLYQAFLRAGLDRSGVVLALGGGVIGDMAGFAAATYLRGIRFVQIPTTLLAMVDASVGGKTGVDLPEGKNLVGAFKQPEMVIIDPDVLSTLPPATFRQGLAEVIKHGIIGDPELFRQLEGAGPASLESLIARALRVKIDIVERDPFEAGERAYLNLGHTFAHAIERVSQYAIPHGDAVALGLIAAGRLAAQRGLCTPETARRIEAVVERLGLPTTLTGYDPQAILQAMSTDKKRRGKRLRFVLPRSIGDVGLFDDVSSDEVLMAVESLAKEGKSP